MKIKKATVEDGEVLAGLAQLLWDGHDLKELTAYFVKQLNDKGSACFLAYEAEAPAGFAQCQLRRDYVEGTASTPVGYLEGILVRPEFRRQGLAKQLLQACQHWAREQGCIEFASDCELFNDDSLQFHLRMGFSEANRIICFVKKL